MIHNLNRSVLMSNGLEKSSMPPLPHSFSLQLVIWEMKLLFSTKGLPHVWLLSGTIPTVLQLHHVLATLPFDFFPSPLSSSVHQGCLFKLWPRNQVTTTHQLGQLRTSFWAFQTISHIFVVRPLWLKLSALQFVMITMTQLMYTLPATISYIGQLCPILPWANVSANNICFEFSSGTSGYRLIYQCQPGLAEPQGEMVSMCTSTVTYIEGNGHSDCKPSNRTVSLLLKYKY